MVRVLGGDVAFGGFRIEGGHGLRTLWVGLGPVSGVTPPALWPTECIAGALVSVARADRHLARLYVASIVIH